MERRINENLKITLTLGQLKKLVRESIKDLGDFPSRASFAVEPDEEEKGLQETYKVRTEELRDELEKFLTDNGVEPFVKGRNFLDVRRISFSGENGYWLVDVFGIRIDFYDNGRVKWGGGNVLSGFDFDDEDDNDEDSIADKKQFRFIQRMMTDKKFVNDLKEIVMRIGGEERDMYKQLGDRASARSAKQSADFNTAIGAQAEKVRNEIRGAKFALIDTSVDDDYAGVLYRNKPCKVIEVGDTEEELQDIAWYPWKHREYQKDIKGKRIYVVPTRLLKFG